MVWEIARTNYLIPYKTRYSMDYQIKVTINQPHTEHASISLQVTTGQIYGDRTYKGFDLSKMLTPPLCDLNLEITFTDTSRVEFQSGKIPCNQLYLSPINLPSDQTNFLIELKNIEFYYDSTSLFNYRNYIGLIHEYLSYSELLDFTLQKIMQINPEDVTHPFITHINVYDLEESYRRFSSFLIPEGLDVPEELNEKFSLRLKTLTSEIRRLRTIFDKTLNSIPYFITPEDYRKGALRVLEIQNDYLKESQRVPHFYQPLYHNMATWFNSDEDWKSFLVSMARQFTRLDSSLMVQNLANNLLDEYQNHLEILAKTSKFNEMLIFLKSAQTICANHPHNSCQIQLFRLDAIARTGIYDSYLQIGENAMLSGNYKLSANYLEKALDFQKNNSAVILVPDAALGLLEKLAWMSFQSGRDANRNHQIKKALENLELSLEIYNLLGLDRYRDVIEKEISDLRLLISNDSEKSPDQMK